MSRYMYKGHMDKAKAGRIEGGRQGCVEWGGVGGKMEAIVLEQQLNKRKM